MFCCLDNKVFLSHLKSKTPILSIEIKKNIRILQTTHTPKGPDKKCKGKKIEPTRLTQWINKEYRNKNNIHSLNCSMHY